MAVIKARTLSHDELSDFLDRPLDWNTDGILSGAVSILKYAEASVIENRQRAIDAAVKEGQSISFDPPQDRQFEAQYIGHLIQTQEILHDVTLPQAFRSSALITMITAVDQSKRYLKRYLAVKVPKPPKNNKDPVYFLDQLVKLAGLDFPQDLADLRNLYWVRHCIVHADGYVLDDRDEVHVRKAVSNLSGFKIGNDDWDDSQIYIGAGVIDGYAERAIHWLGALEKACRKQNLVAFGKKP